LVHEAYLRLVGNAEDFEWNGRGHFFAGAAEAMRQNLLPRCSQQLAGREKLPPPSQHDKSGGQKRKISSGFSIALALNHSRLEDAP
jgi:ECF sigma factor